MRNSSRNKQEPLSSNTANLSNEKWAANTQLSSHIADIRECDSILLFTKGGDDSSSSVSRLP